MNKKTSDIYLAAALLALGGQIRNIIRDDPRHMEFEFLGDLGIDLDDIERKWVNGTLEGNYLHYKDAIQRMKSLVHSG